MIKTKIDYRPSGMTRKISIALTGLLGLSFILFFLLSLGNIEGKSIKLFLIISGILLLLFWFYLFETVQICTQVVRITRYNFIYVDCFSRKIRRKSDLKFISPIKSFIPFIGFMFVLKKGSVMVFCNGSDAFALKAQIVGSKMALSGD